MSLDVFSSPPVFISSFSVIRVLHFSLRLSLCQKISVGISTAHSARFLAKRLSSLWMRLWVTRVCFIFSNLGRNFNIRNDAPLVCVAVKINWSQTQTSQSHQSCLHHNEVWTPELSVQAESHLKSPCSWDLTFNYVFINGTHIIKRLMCSYVKIKVNRGSSEAFLMDGRMNNCMCWRVLL